VHGRHHLAQQILVTPCFTDEVFGYCEDMRLLLSKAWSSASTSLLTHQTIDSSQSEREFRNLAAPQFPENRGATIIIEF
jgi:hypothetical protein